MIVRRSLLPAVLVLSARAAHAFTFVSISTSAPVGLEKTFLGTTTAQYLGNVIANPLAANTYSLLLFGPNPSYQAPLPPPSTLEQALSLGSTIFVYGFADGMESERTNTERMVGGFGNLCGSATNFMLLQTSIGTFDSSTCLDVLSTIENSLYQLSLSTPPVIMETP